MAATKIMIDGVQYDSIKKAAEIIGKSPGFISTRLNNDERGFEGWQRLPAEPQKPGRPKASGDQTSLVVRCTHSQKQAFMAACELLGTTTEEFISTAMKGATLNAVHAMRENLIEVGGLDADDFEAGVMKSWAPKRNQAGDVLPVDAM